MPETATSETGALLAVKDLEAWYGELHILHGVTFDVQPGEVVTLLGRNGVGKTTTLKAIMGIIESRTGSVRFEGQGADPPSFRRHRPRRHRFLPGRARHILHARRQGKSAAAAAGAARAGSTSNASSSFSQPARAAA